jgi:hypothetical protein
MDRPESWVDSTKIYKEAQLVVFSQNQKPSFIPHTKPVTPTPPSTPLNIQKLSSAEMVGFQLKGLCYKCDDKYFLGHKCKEQNIFMAISKDVLEEDVEAPIVFVSPEPTDITPPEVELVISLNSLTSFSAPQTLKIIGYIKHRRSSFLLIVEALIILFTAVFPKKPISISE